MLTSHNLQTPEGRKDFNAATEEAVESLIAEMAAQRAKKQDKPSVSRIRRPSWQYANSNPNGGGL